MSKQRKYNGLTEDEVNERLQEWYTDGSIDTTSKQTVFILTDTRLININSITTIDIKNINKLELNIFTNVNERPFQATGIRAIDILMQLKPNALEGVKELKWKPGVWKVHNMLGHPLMQILCGLGFNKAGIWVHDNTVPKPEGVK